MSPSSDVEPLFIHGSGRRGIDAWPTQDAASGTFLSFPPESAVEDQVVQLLRDHSANHLVVFAHSIGAVPAVIAAASGVLTVRALVLVEPALYDIARGSVSVERHIGIVSDARALASSGDLRGFWGLIRPLMFGGPLDAEKWERETVIAQRWATTNVPWGHGARARMVRGIPTLVVTGGWNDEYEEIASILTTEGAEHEVLRGAQHRPQDLPGFSPLVDDFLTRARAKTETTSARRRAVGDDTPTP